MQAPSSGNFSKTLQVLRNAVSGYYDCHGELPHCLKCLNVHKSSLVAIINFFLKISKKNIEIVNFIGVMRRHDLTNKTTMTKTFTGHPQRVIPETCDIWDIWSDWGSETWPDQNRHWQWHLENTNKEQCQRFVVFETFLINVLGDVTLVRQ